METTIGLPTAVPLSKPEMSGKDKTVAQLTMPIADNMADPIDLTGKSHLRAR
jgi:hypothetical protein